MLNCPTTLSFSMVHCEKRLAKAHKLLGVTVVNRIIGFTLFLLGAKREDIAQYLKMPFGTLLSFLRRIDRHGLSTFEDRRKSSNAQTPGMDAMKISLSQHDKFISIQLNDKHQFMNIPRNNLLQCKVVLLSLLNQGFLSLKEISCVFGCSTRHIRELQVQMHKEDIYCLIDKREGQRHDYKFTPEIKAEIIQQFVLNVINHDRVSGKRIARNLQERCQLKLSPRSILFHFSKLGLNHIRESLPTQLAKLKKKSSVS